ncbi:MAG: phosphate ABC transporter ATP-binding protein [Chloroflexi bacterium]|jgi:phosphate transport system ATP-binding protein|nr:phosphate ABC transporter ATP-binding protein [Chloroflexota bacterium]
MNLFKPYISVEGLNVSYKKCQALENITVAIPEKQITVIIGPSGCGKTTLLKCLNRLIDLTDGVKLSGRVLVDGVDIYNSRAVDATHIRRKMGLLSQRPFPLPMSIYDNVAYGLRLNGLKDKLKVDAVVEHYLKMVGLWEEVKHRLKNPAWNLSAGQQQRLCLARSLAVEPEAILGDEPTSALDPMSSQRIEKIFLELKSQYTIVIVTHILRQAKRLADYVIFLYLGKLIEHGPAHSIFENPKEPETQAYIRGEIS